MKTSDLTTQLLTTKAFGMKPPLRLPQKALASKLLLPIPALPGMLVLPLR